MVRLRTFKHPLVSGWELFSTSLFGLMSNSEISVCFLDLTELLGTGVFHWRYNEENYFSDISLELQTYSYVFIHTPGVLKETFISRQYKTLITFKVRPFNFNALVSFHPLLEGFLLALWSKGVQILHRSHFHLQILRMLIHEHWWAILHHCCQD